MDRLIRLVFAVTVTASGPLRAAVSVGQTAEEPSTTTAPASAPSEPPVMPPASPPTLLDPNVRPIDLNTALRLAGVQNPQLMIARQRVVEAAALRQLAAVQILPSINVGM